MRRLFIAAFLILAIAALGGSACGYGGGGQGSPAPSSRY
jgi:hypothetical protein